MGILDEIAKRTGERIDEAKKRVPLATVRATAEERAATDKAKDAFVPFPFEAALRKADFGLICEVKQASPSKGVIAQDFDPLSIARDYEQAGADAISCLTEPYWFLGSDDYLAAIAHELAAPVLRKDFTVDEYMIYQAKALGASAVLLICAILDDAQLRSYGALAEELGLSALVEAHDASEIDRALACGARIIGVNNRNLKDFSIDLDNANSLRAKVPEEVLFVAESGVTSPADIAMMAAAGANAALVGEALMRSETKLELIASMRSAAQEGRRA